MRARPADTIQFIAALEGKTLVLTGGELLVTQDLTIDGGDDPRSPSTAM